MKPERRVLITEFRRLVQTEREPLVALGLSLAIHFALLVGVNLLLAWPAASPRFKLRPMTFDFIMTPSGDAKQAPEAKPPRTRGTARRSLPPAAAVANDGPSIASASMENFAPATTTENSTPEPASVHGPFTGRGTGAYALSTYSEPAAPLLNSARVAPTLMPYKFAVPATQRKAILKKVKEFSTTPFALTTRDSSFVWEKNGQRFQFNVQSVPAQSATGLDELWVGVSTVEGNDTLTTQFRMKRLAFSQFAQFVDFWDPQVALHDDEFDGRVHSNSAMVINSSRATRPQFRGKVSTAAYAIRHSERSFYREDSTIFLAGLEAGTAAIPLPRVFPGIPRDTSRATGHVNLFSEESWITFHRDGAYSWHTASQPAREQRARPGSEPYSLIGKARLHVQGVVRGKVLVYSARDILIDDDLLYDQNPEAFASSQDFLGLVANEDIEISPPAVTGPGDLRIFAALMAKGRFCVPQLYTRDSGTLHIYGSLSAGSISATEPRYATRVRFDKRFEKMRPPNFPMTNRYEIAEWDERWMVK